MVSTVLGLRFEVRHRHFQKGEMRLRCTATLSEVMRMSSDPLEADISEQHMSDLHVDFNRASGKLSERNLLIFSCPIIGFIFNFNFETRFKNQPHNYF